MSGPWEEFAAPATASPAPAAAPASGSIEPWKEYAAPQGGGAYGGEIQGNDEFMGVKPATDHASLRVGLQELTKKRAAPEVLKNYLVASASPSDQTVLDFIDGPYSEAIAKGETPTVDWQVQAPPEANSPIEIWWDGAKSGALRGYDDEWQGFFGALGNKIGSGLGLNESNAGFGDIYETIRDQYRAEKDASYNQNKLLYGAGFLPGAMTGPIALQGGRVGTAGSTAGNVAQAGRVGAVQGGLSGSGNAEGGFWDRLTSGGFGAALGAPLGMALYPAQAAVNAVGGRIWEAIRPSARNADSGLDVLATRAPQDAAAMRAEADAMAASGVPPRLIDVMDETGRRVARGATHKNTPAQQDLATHADGVYVNAQGRVADQARTHISNARGTARDLGRTIQEEQAAMGPQFDAVRNNTVELTPEVIQSLNTAEGRSVLRTIGRLMTPEEQGPLNALIAGLNKASKQKPFNEDEYYGGLIPGWDRMPEPARAQVRSQVPPPPRADPMEGAVLTVDIADKFARLITKAAETKPALMRVAENYAGTLRGAARQQHPEYDAALTEFAARAGVGNAAAGTGRTFGHGQSDFLATPPDDFVQAVSAASPDPAAASAVGAGAAPSAPPVPTISEADALRMRARDDVVDRATSGSGAQAMSTARQISRGDAQAGRNAALLGGQRAEALETSMGNEVRRVDNTRFVDPRIGSKTATAGDDMGPVEGITTAVNAATSGKWGLVRGVVNWAKSSGIRGIDAERLTRDVISEDPARVRAAIDYLERKGIEGTRARGLIRSIQTGSIVGRPAGAYAGSEERPAPPNSVRAIMKEDRR